jgi:colanic acid/amylovoran biosynthesis glycosyltransferase
MNKMAILIPEFPSQTHAFFIREREELKRLGVETVLISTRHPDGQEGIANHDWALEAKSETTYLYPLSAIELALFVIRFLIAGPRAWYKCIKSNNTPADTSFRVQLKKIGLSLMAIKLKTFCQREGIAHVHVHSCANAANVAMLSRLLDGPQYSLTLHGPLMDYGPNQMNKWKNAAFGIVITQDLHNELFETLDKENLPPVFLAPMGVDLNKFCRTTPYEICAADEVLRLVSCGRLNYVKAHDDLIRVVGKLKQMGRKVELRICGAMDAPSQEVNYIDELIKLAKELDVINEVMFLGSVSESRVKEELSKAHFFCLASLKEPLGVATMEAMAMEIPVIVARSPGVEEMVVDGENGFLVEPRSPEQFVNKIINSGEDSEFIFRVAKNGRKTVEQKFHSGISAQKLHDGLLINKNSK